MSFLYQVYLNSFGEFGLDEITRNVGLQVKQLLNLFDNNSIRIVETDSNYFTFFYKQQEIARIIEGCNAISVIILFISFVVAFSGKLNNTLLFIIVGSMVIYVLNVFRIAALCVLLFNFPEHGRFLHSVLFPLFIYGVVFILWLIWVNNFSKYAKKTIQS